MELGELSNQALVSRMTAFCSEERALLAQVLAGIIEIEKRRLHLELGSSSLYDFCVHRLGMSEGSAFRRIAAARLVRDFPCLLPRVASGGLHLSGILLLRGHLTEVNAEELARDASGLPESKLRELLAERSPRPPVPERVEPMTTQGVLGNAAAPLTAPRSSTEPLSPTTYLARLTLSAVTHAKLLRARDMLRHREPAGELAAVVDRALDVLLDKLERERLGKANRPRPSRVGTSDVTRSTRREVIARDGEQCTYRSESGDRCQARALLEFDHGHARALGGEHGPDNIQVLCAAHNRFHAEKDFGKGYIAKKIARRRAATAARKLRSATAEGPGPSRTVACTTGVDGSGKGRTAVIADGEVPTMAGDACNSTTAPGTFDGEGSGEVVIAADALRNTTPGHGAVAPSAFDDGGTGEVVTAADTVCNTTPGHGAVAPSTFDDEGPGEVVTAADTLRDRKPGQEAVAASAFDGGGPSPSPDPTTSRQKAVAASTFVDHAPGTAVTLRNRKPGHGAVAASTFVDHAPGTAVTLRNRKPGHGAVAPSTFVDQAPGAAVTLRDRKHGHGAVAASTFVDHAPGAAVTLRDRKPGHRAVAASTFDGEGPSPGPEPTTSGQERVRRVQLAQVGQAERSRAHEEGLAVQGLVNLGFARNAVLDTVRTILLRSEGPPALVDLVREAIGLLANTRPMRPSTGGKASRTHGVREVSGRTSARVDETRALPGGIRARA